MRRLLLILAALLCPLAAHATSYALTGTGTLASNVSTNWTPTGIPGSGDTASCSSGQTLSIPTGVTFTIGTSPVTGGTSALVKSCALVVTGTLDLQGPVTDTAGGWTLSAGGTIHADFSLAGSPSSTTWAWTVSGAQAQTCNGTQTTPSVIDSDTSGGIMYFAGATSDNFTWNCSWTTIRRFGSASLFGIGLNQSSACTVQTFFQVTFDTDGTIGDEPSFQAPACGGVSFINNTWKNSLGTGGSLKILGAANPTATRLVKHNVFDTAPSLDGRGMDVEQNYFNSGYAIPAFGTGASGQYSKFDSNFIRVVFNPASGNGDPLINSDGDLTNNYIWLDRLGNPFNGTASGGTATTVSSTITFSGTPFTAHQFRSCSGSCSPNTQDYFVFVNSGTGMNTFGSIFDNTTNTLTVQYSVPVDSTSGISIYNGIGNPHIMTPTNSPASATFGGTSGGIQVIESGNTDNNGDCYLTLTGTFTYQLVHNLILPNAMRDDTCTFHTLFNNTTAKVSDTSNTIWPASQAPAVSEGGTVPAGAVVALESNIFVSDPALASIYYLSASSGGGTPSGLGPFAFDDEACSTTGTVDIIVAGMADHNGRFGLKSTTCAGTSNQYSTKTSVTPGASDLTTDPAFTDNTRGFRTCAVAHGAPGNLVAAADYALARMQEMNSPSFNTAFSIPNLMACVTAGWTPANAAYATGGVGGTYLGAIQPPAPPSGTVLGGSVKASAVIQ